MTADASLQPFGESEQELGGGSPHLTDYWAIISRRIWLVLLVFGVTTAGAMWQVSRQKILYTSRLAIQVSDPLQPSRGLAIGGLSGMDVFVDPIQSEIELLRSTTIAASVVDSLGLRIFPSTSELVRSHLFSEAMVPGGDEVNGSYELLYGEGGNSAVLRDMDGQVLGSAAVGQVLNAGFVHFRLRRPPLEDLSYPLEIVASSGVSGSIRGGLVASPRESTNIIDVTYTVDDPELAPRILNSAALALREYGARKVRTVASQERRFIEDRLETARAQLTTALGEIQHFKETSEFVDLSVQERNLITESQSLVTQIRDLEGQRSLLSNLVRDLEDTGSEEVDLVELGATLEGGRSTQIADLVTQTRRLRDRRRVLMAVDRKTEDHPEVMAIRVQLATLTGELLEAIGANLRVIETRLDGLTAQQGDLRARQLQFPALENRLQTLELQSTLNKSTYEYLLSQLELARITEAAASPYVDVVDPATGVSPIQPRSRITILLGAMLGLIMGVGASFFLEYLDRTVRTSSDVETLLGLPVLGVIPRLRRVAEGEELEVMATGKSLPMVVALDPLDPAAEAYRNLRMNLMFMSTDDSPIRSITFSSPGPDEGKSTTAVNFSVMLAQQGQRVLLIDADLRRPSLHRALDLLREPGLTNLLVGDVEPKEAIRPNVLPNLDFLPSGPFPPNPSELLSSKSMRRLLEDFEAKYGQVIIDSPPVLAVTDAALLSAHTDGLVLVLRSGATEQRAAERAVDQLRRIGVRLFGAVLNEVESSSTEDSYYLQYYYSYNTVPQSNWQKIRQGLSRARFW